MLPAPVLACLASLVQPALRCGAVHCLRALSQVPGREQEQIRLAQLQDRQVAWRHTKSQVCCELGPSRGHMILVYRGM